MKLSTFAHEHLCLRCRNNLTESTSDVTKITVHFLENIVPTDKEMAYVTYLSACVGKDKNFENYSYDLTALGNFKPVPTSLSLVDVYTRSGLTP
jgi:hypothetical protein